MCSRENQYVPVTLNEPFEFTQRHRPQSANTGKEGPMPGNIWLFIGVTPVVIRNPGQFAWGPENRLPPHRGAYVSPGKRAV